MALAMLMPISGTFNFPIHEHPTITQLQEIILQCDTSSAPVIINLPVIETYFGGQLTFIVKVNDNSNNASTNPITINTAGGNFFIGSQTQFIINGNGASVELIIVSTTRWSVLTASSQLPVFSGQKIITPADMLVIHTTPFNLVRAIIGKTIQPISLVSTLNFNSIGRRINIRYGTFDSTTTVIPSAMIDSVVSDINSGFVAQAVSSAVGNLSDYQNKDFNLMSNGAITTGNSSITVDYQYTIVG